jgi:hypothetical protein
MIRVTHVVRGLGALAFSLAAVSAYAQAAPAAPATPAAQKPFEPVSGQAGKDVVWVPTPQATVDRMLDITHLTATDYLIDLGSGDGITVITAAKKGATAVGVEFNPDMVTLARSKAKAAGVSNKATFIQGDLYEADLSKATVITLFLLPEINLKLRPKLLDLKPGTRIASNTFTMDDWEPDAKSSSPECASWCTALFWVVPAKVAGTWQLGQQTLTLTQQFQMVSGTLGSTAISGGKLNGEEITFSAGSRKYTGRVNGASMSGADWSATKK